MKMQVIPISHSNGKDPVNILGFTNDQRKAYEDLIKFINSDYNPDDYKRALVGPAGTGKTYLVRALIKNCDLSYSTIGLAAPTHKACRVLSESIKISNVKINTLASDLGFRLNFDIEKFDIDNPPFDPKGRIKIGDYKVYIVDESSMINRGLLMFLEKTCKSKRCKIIYIGDSSQLAPVNEKFSASFRNVKTFKLNEIVRQEEDNPVRHLLDLLRYDVEHKTFKFLNYIYKNPSAFDENYVKGYQVCNTKDFESLIYTNFSDEQLEKNVDFCKVIAYTNMCVSSWNKYIRQAVIKDADKSIITNNDLLISYTTIVNQFNEPVIKNSEDYILKDVVNYIHPLHNLKGFLVRFTSIHGGITTQPLFILDHTDKASLQKYVEMSRNLIASAKNSPSKLRAQKWRDYYGFKEGILLLTNIVNSSGKTEFSRSIDYGFALTSHKSQGSTFDTVFVDIDDIVYDRNGRVYTDAEEINRRLYVACSRCRNKLYLKLNAR